MRTSRFLPNAKCIRCALALLTLPFSLLPGQRGLKPAPADLKIDVSVAMVPVTVTTPVGMPVLGLQKENFRLFDDGVEQKITFLAGEDLPLSMGLVFDLSASMREKLAKSSQAVTALLRTLDHSEDEFFLVQFNERPKLAVPFTRDVEEIEAQLHRGKAFGRTALLDALHLAEGVMRHARNPRRAIVILSDGGDNHSRYTATEVRNEMRESDVSIYAMALRSSREERHLPREERDGPQLLKDMAGDTGGRHLDLAGVDDLKAACMRISLELHNQYVIGYSPPATHGQKHQIRITAEAADASPLRVAHRHYIAAHIP